MKIKSTLLVISITVLALLLTSCTGAGSTVNSWSGVMLTDTNVYFANSGQVFSLRSENGNIVWQYPEKASPTRLFLAAPALTGEQLIVGDYGNLLTSLSIRDGQENWQFTGAKGRYIDSPLIVGEVIVAPNADNHLYALDLAGKLIWNFTADNSFWVQPVSDGKTVFAPCLDHKLYALDLATGKLKWKVDLESSIVARPALFNGVIYVGNLDGGFFAINSESGRVIWDQKVAGGIWAAPVLVESQLFFGDQTGKINILNAEDGSIHQTVDTASAILGSGVVLTEGVAFGNEKGELILLGTNGEKMWTRSVDGSIYSNLVVVGDQLVVVATKGAKLLVAMDQNGNENWYFSTK
ncbi:MAG: PQQ-like beta-propeller repeat protein [Chloroflexi bacterium]|nr:PQQ-like beta-propeller repeat protein [Chloroflexota bacterium]